MARIGKCFICGKPKIPNSVIVRVSPKLWRHEHCQVGSPNWLKSNRAKKSEFKKLFKGE